MTLANNGQRSRNVRFREMLAHLRPSIEAEAREAALREAAAICQRENWDDAAENAILALIEKEPTNAG